MKRKILSTLVVVLLIGLALAPSINADVSREEDLVELDVEFCGLGRKHTVKLTQDEYDEVELIFDEVQDKLSLIKSDDEAVEIFSEAIVKLDKYGLLGGLSVKLAQELVIGNKIRQNYIKQIDNLDKNNLDFLSANYFCLIIGNIKNMVSQNFIMRSSWVFYNVLGSLFIEVGDWAKEKGFDNLENFANRVINSIEPKMELLLAFNIFTVTILHTFGLYHLIPFSFFRTLFAGCRIFFPDMSVGYIPSDLNITSIGLVGIKQWEGDFWGDASDYELISESDRYYPAIIGYTGITFTWNFNTHLLGFALKVDFTNTQPPEEIK